MEYSKKQIIQGVETIKELRRNAYNNCLSVSKTTAKTKPFIRSRWTAALRNLSVTKFDTNNYTDRSFWDQSKFESDYDLCVAILDECRIIQSKYDAALTKKHTNKTPATKYFIEFDHLKMTEDEYRKLTMGYGAEKVDSIIEKIKNYKKNTKYKSLYLTAKAWLSRDYNTTEQEVKVFNNAFENYFIDDQPAEPIKEQKTDLVSEPKKPKTRWLKILGIKIYEKSIN